MTARGQIVLFALLDRWADWEAAYLSAELRTPGGGRFEVATLSPSPEPVSSIGGIRVLPDYDLQTVPGECAALILVGGTSWRTEKAQRSRLLGGICDASVYSGRSARSMASGTRAMIQRL